MRANVADKNYHKVYYVIIIVLIALTSSAMGWAVRGSGNGATYVLRDEFITYCETSLKRHEEIREDIRSLRIALDLQLASLQQQMITLAKEKK